MAERFSERPRAVKAALGAAKRSLDGEDRSATIPPEGMARCSNAVKPSPLPTTNPEYPKFLCTGREADQRVARKTEHLREHRSTRHRLTYRRANMMRSN